MQPSNFPVISITSGMAGFFAVLYWWNPEGFAEPFETGSGRYPKTIQGELNAINEAKNWAESEEIRLDPLVLAREKQLKEQLGIADRYGPFDMVAGQTDPNEDVP